MGKTILVSDLMESSGVKFGTSGARGLVTDMTDEVCYAYTVGFLRYLEDGGLMPTDDMRVAVAGDLRPSTDRIMSAVARAIVDRGRVPVNCGKVPSPTVALYGIREGVPAVMVTGSHIPADRNGIKYNKPSGEILKVDESGIKEQQVEIPDSLDCEGALPAETDDARKLYLRRYLDAFPANFLAGRKIGLYQHSAVGRELLYEIYTALGADVTKLGPSEKFIPVDTEAIRPEDVELAAGWAAEHGFDAIVSTDGDSDRPLISDETGKWLRGDVAGILCAQFMGADSVVTPVSCNTAAEKCGSFAEVRRTRIGSPYVIAGMQEATAAGSKCVVGYEANGGFLTASEIPQAKGPLGPLPTRDAAIIHLGILSLSISQNKPVSALLSALPQRFTVSDRIKNFAREMSLPKIAELTKGGAAAIESAFSMLGPVKDADETDGLRITFESDEVLHLRPSGNAPELRCYTEADTEARALELNAIGMKVLETWK